MGEKRYEYTAFGLATGDDEEALKRAEMDGKTIQFWNYTLKHGGEWVDIQGKASWSPTSTYRVKPEEKEKSTYVIEQGEMDAFDKSIAYWQEVLIRRGLLYKVDHGCEGGSCALCTYHRTFRSCAYCIVGKTLGSCGLAVGPFAEWKNNPSSETHRAMLHAMIEVRSRCSVKPKEKKPSWKPWDPNTTPYPCLVRLANGSGKKRGILSILQGGVTIADVCGVISYRVLAEKWEWQVGSEWLPCWIER